MLKQTGPETSLVHRGRRWTKVLLLLAANLFTVGACGPQVETPPDANGTPSGAWMNPLGELPGALLSVHVTHPKEVWLAGAVGESPSGPMLWRGDAEGWRQLLVGGAADLWWVTGAGPDHVVAVGALGTMIVIERASMRAWRVDTGTDATLFGAWGESLERVTVVGGRVHPQQGPAVMLEVDAREAAQNVDSVALAAVVLPNDPLFKVWGDGDGGVWAVGNNGVVMRWEGVWTAESLPDTSRLVTIHGDGASLYAVGGSQRAKVVRSEDRGLTWADDSPGAYAGLSGVALGPAGQVMACGVLGTALERSSQGWRDIELPLGADWHGAAIDELGTRWLVGGNLGSGTLNGGRVLAQNPWTGSSLLSPQNLHLPPGALPDASDTDESDESDASDASDASDESTDTDLPAPDDVKGEDLGPEDLGPDDVAPSDFPLVLGTVDGSFNFTPIVSGANAEIVQGPQGGIHLDIAASIVLSEVSAASVSIAFEAHTWIANKEVGSRILAKLDLVRVGDGHYQSGSTLVIFNTDLAAPYVGETAVVDVTVTWQGQQAFASTTLQLVDTF